MEPPAAEVDLRDEVERRSVDRVGAQQALAGAEALGKKVQDSRLLDDMRDPGTWRFSGTGTLTRSAPGSCTSATSTSTVGRPRESQIRRAATCLIFML